MNCERTQEAFSELFDGSLSTRREELVRVHLDSCSACRDAWSEFGAALEALRATGSAPTSNRLRESILTAVDAVAATEAQVSETAFERATVLAAARQGRHERRRSALVSFASAVGGLAAGFILFFGTGGPAPSFEATSGPAAVEPRTPIVAAVDAPRVAPSPQVERVPEVEQAPEIIVRFVSVPTIVQRVVTVPELVEVERIVERGPLFAIDLAPLERFGTALLASVDGLRDESEAWVDDLQQRLAARATVLPESELELPVALASPRSSRTARERPLLVSSVSVRRVEDEITLETRGPLADVVPLLVAQLDDEDPRVRELVARRLESIRNELAADPLLGPQLRDVPERADVDRSAFERWFGSEPEPERDPSERWSEWRAVNRELLVAAGPQPGAVRRGL